MDMNELTKEQVNEMSDDELMVWHEVFQRQNQVNNVRKGMLEFVEIREASEPKILHVDSTVVN
jgi:hypothetical protein